MALIGYKLDAVRARIGALWIRWLGVVVAADVRIHPGARLRCARGHGVLGERVILYRGVQLLCNRKGRFRIGRHTHIAPHSYLLVGDGSLEIGEQVAMGPYCGIFCESNGTQAGAPFCEQYVRGDVHIGSNVFLGTKVTVLPGSHIENDVVVAAHSVVHGRLASGWVYGGAPARPLRPVVPA